MNIQHSTISSDLLSKVAQGIAGGSSHYLDELTQGLCDITAADFAVIGCLSHDGSRVQTASVYVQGQHVDGFTYTLDCSPCEEVLRSGSCVVDHGVIEAFPQNHLLAQTGAEGYIGTRLDDREGNPIGLIALLTMEPVTNPWALLSLQRIFAAPAGLALERSRQQHVREHLERTLDSILSIAEEAIIAIDRDLHIVLFNEGAENTFGYEAEDIIGESINVLLPERLRERHEGLMQDFLESHQTSRLMNQRSGNLIGLRSDGTEFPAEASITKSDTGPHKTIMVVLRDITERTRSEFALQYGQKMETLGNMAAGLAHDFNNILTVIRGAIDFSFMDGPGSAQSLKQLDMALKEIDRGADLAARLLTLGKTRHREPIVVDPCELLEQLIDMLRHCIGEGVEIALDYDHHCGWTLIDPSQLENAIVNLALNSKDAMNGSGKLEIELRNADIDELDMASRLELDRGAYVCVSVRDSGTGMSKEVLARAFEPFFSQRRDNGGTGLGLSMVYGFARSAGGGVNIESAEGIGTTVELYLPRTDRQPSDDTSDNASQGSSRQARILIVEDHAQIRELAVFYAEDAGYDVLEAADASTALDLLNSAGDIDLVFVDYQLPGDISGLDVARDARQRGIDVIMTSGHHKCDEDISDFTLLVKPYSGRALTTAIEEKLQSRIMIG